MSTRTRRLLATLAVAALPLAALAACGDDDDGGSGTGEGAAVQVTDAWARTSPAMATAGAVYMGLEADQADALVGVSVDASVAAKAEIHETVMGGGDMTGTTAGGDTTAGGTATTMAGGGEMSMRPVERIDLPAGEIVYLEPGGYHIMLLDLAAPLEVGSTIKVTLQFATAPEEVVDVPVEDR